MTETMVPRSKSWESTPSVLPLWAQRSDMEASGSCHHRGAGVGRLYVDINELALHIPHPEVVS